MTQAASIQSLVLLQQVIVSRLSSWYVLATEGYSAYLTTINDNIKKLEATLVLEPENKLIKTELALQQIAAIKFKEAWDTITNKG